MSVKKVIAIVNELRLDTIESALGAHGVTGFSIHPVMGRGNYFNTFPKNNLVKHIQIEVFTSDKHSTKIAELIMSKAHVGASNEGLVAVISVDELFWISEQKAISDDQYQYFDDVAP
ncbi:P-II family nitrogen regulator [uncultured Paraglaciecola sp.]|uniref:P-II family nitrogen regulator n=1 Tax=uncultured Paraglaciecola sp. TaxID=1765024 RepID=UPI0030D9B0FB|tara:strand:+ start:171 stop:521 length:351 start_codon:yes stop_codon:yes gene_type:complete